MDIKRAIFLLDNSNLPSGCYREIKELLVELEQRRKSDLRPADKFLNNTLKQQLEHMESELEEIKGEIIESIDDDDLAIEIIDLQMSCQTMLEGPLDLTTDYIAYLRRKVIEKNRERGYYNG
jgi:hypothetical protein